MTTGTVETPGPIVEPGDIVQLADGRTVTAHREQWCGRWTGTDENGRQAAFWPSQVAVD